MKVAALYRHPIKSHGRESIEAAHLIAGQTMPWDRTWAVTHEASKVDPDNPAWAACHNFMVGARTPGLAGLWATLDPESRQVTLTHEALGDIAIQPDDAADVARFLEWIAPICPQNRARPTGIVTAATRGMTDSDFPSVSIMTTASHNAVAQALGGPLERERWRGNIWLDGTAAWDEFDWLGRDLQIGEATLRLRERIERCPHTAANPYSGVRDTDTLGTLDRFFGHQDFGVHAEVVQDGTVRTGDQAALI